MQGRDTVRISVYMDEHIGKVVSGTLYKTVFALNILNQVNNLPSIIWLTNIVMKKVHCRETHSM